MLKGAPPMLVVGVALRVVVIALEITMWMLGEPALGRESQTLAFAGELAAGVMVTTGAIELAVRTRGHVRIGCVIAAVAQVGGMVVTLAVTVLLARLQRSYRLDADHTLILIQVLSAWVIPLTANLTIVGFVVATGRRAIGASLGALACTLLISPIPPVIKLIKRALESSAGVIGYGTLYLALALFVIRLGAVIARSGEVVSRDHERAVRGARVVLAAVAVRVVVAALFAVVGFTAVPAGVFGTFADAEPTHGSLAIVANAVDLLALATLVRGTWLMARAHHPSLATGMLHIALACALCSLIALAYLLQSEATLSFDAMLTAVPPWTMQLGGTLTFAWLVVVIGRLSRRTPAIKRTVVLGGALFTLAACAGVAMHRNEGVAALLSIVANFALLPVLRATARAIAADPIKSTADVFA